MGEEEGGDGLEVELLMVPTLLTDETMLLLTLAGVTWVLGDPLRLDFAVEVVGDWVVKTVPLLVITICPTLLACTSCVAPRFVGECVRD